MGGKKKEKKLLKPERKARGKKKAVTSRVMKVEFQKRRRLFGTRPFGNGQKIGKGETS